MELESQINSWNMKTVASDLPVVSIVLFQILVIVFIP
jgi:hypothetical protein